MASGNQIAKGAFVGTGVDLNVTKVGFKPSFVKVWNVTDPVTFEHVEGMADDSAYKDLDGTTTVATSNGITLLVDGFTLGADTDINVDGEVCHFIAFR